MPCQHNMETAIYHRNFKSQNFSTKVALWEQKGVKMIISSWICVNWHEICYKCCLPLINCNKKCEFYQDFSEIRVPGSLRKSHPVVWLGVTKGPEEVNTKPTGYHQIKNKNSSNPAKNIEKGESQQNRKSSNKMKKMPAQKNKITNFFKMIPTKITGLADLGRETSRGGRLR